MLELNPNHPVTRDVHDHWHKIAALLMVKFNVTTIDIFPADIDRLDQAHSNIMIHAKMDRLTLRIVGDEEAKKLAREHGGLPV